MYIPEEKQIVISKLTPRGMKSYIVGYMEITKILRLYKPQKAKVFTSEDVESPRSTKYLELTKIKSLSNLVLHLDSDAP
jgi:hypothetical protein